jgi:hypothetical protein
LQGTGDINMSDLTRRILIALLLAALAVALVFGTVKGYEHWRDAVRAEGDKAGAARVQALWDKDIEKRDADTMKKVAEARADEQRMAADAAKGEADARRHAEERAQAHANAARLSTAAAGSLRDDLAALDGAARALGIPDAASCPREFARQRDEAIRARAVLGACVAEYRQLGQDADDAVAGLELRLDTALTWIRATGAPGADQLSDAP